MDFVMSLPLLVEWKGNSYNAILVMVNYLIKIVYYRPIKTIIDIAGLAEVVINIVVRCHSLPKSIIIDQGSLFTSKF